MEERIVSMKSDFFKALAHPTRVRILERLAKNSEEVCVCELIKDLGVEQSNLSQHLSILRKQQIITSTKVGLKVMYRINREEYINKKFHSNPKVKAQMGQANLDKMNEFKSNSYGNISGLTDSRGTSMNGSGNAISSQYYN